MEQAGVESLSLAPGEGAGAAVSANQTGWRHREGARSGKRGQGLEGLGGFLLGWSSQDSRDRALRAALG